jgi:hypothetical protein
VTEPESSKIFLKPEITRTLHMFTGPARLEKLAIETYASTGNRRLKRQIGFAAPNCLEITQLTPSTHPIYERNRGNMLDGKGGGGVGTPWNRLKCESSGLPPPCPSISGHPPPFFTISFLYTSAAGSTRSKHVAPI